MEMKYSSVINKSTAVLSFKSTTDSVCLRCKYLYSHMNPIIIYTLYTVRKREYRMK